MIKLILLTLILSSCSSLPSKGYLTQIKNQKETRIKKIPVKDRAQAKIVIQNHLNFLNLLFEQSYDPYYNVPKWEPQCLRDNQIGPLIEDAKEIKSISRLFLDPSGEFGKCGDTPNTYPAHVIYLYCEPSQEVLEIKTPQQQNMKLEEIKLCEP